MARADYEVAEVLDDVVFLVDLDRSNRSVFEGGNARHPDLVDHHRPRTGATPCP